MNNVTTAAPIVTDFAAEATAYKRSGLISFVSVQDTAMFLAENHDAIVEALSVAEFRNGSISAFIGKAYINADIKEDGQVRDLYLSFDMENVDGSFVTWYHRDPVKPALVQFIEQLHTARA